MVDNTLATIVIVPTQCANCGVVFGVTEVFDRSRRQDGKDFYCPNGHCLTFKKAVSKELQDALDRADRAERRAMNNERWALEEAQRRLQTERSLSATKGQVTKLKKRAAAGVCPYCTRHFSALQRHIASKHPEHVHDGEQVPS